MNLLFIERPAIDRNQMKEAQQKLVHTFAALADLGQAVASTDDFEEMVRTSLHLLLGALAIRRGVLAEHDVSIHALKSVAVRGMGDTPVTDISLDKADIATLLAIGFQGISREEAGVASCNIWLKCQHLFSALSLELVIPLVVHTNLTGIILLGGKASGEPFSSDDREVIWSMARHIGVGIHTHRLLQELEHKALENRDLYNGLRGLYKDTVKAFAAAIDIKDKYTQGHSERVGKYCEIIAREMGWSEDEVEGIAVAGYLHDIGKLVVERDIINAPYKIDAQKSTELNRHPAAGYEILKPIRHLYADIPLMALHHHERMDGKGYPDGLTGDQIPAGVKIVTLADSFDAMTTDRPYKRRRSLDDVVSDFRENTGKQFAPEVVAAFCSALLKEVTGEASSRRITKILGKNYVDPARLTPLLSELISDLRSGKCGMPIAASFSLG